MSRLHALMSIMNEPLAAHQGKVQIISNALLTRAGLPVVDWVSDVPQAAAESVGDRAGVTMEARDVAVSGGGMQMDSDVLKVAVIDVAGTFSNRIATESPSGFASYERVARSMRSAAANPEIAGILLRIDSFGGVVDGMHKAASAIAKARETKPVWCVVDDNAYSAGYCLAAQCEKVFIPREGGGVGSVGVFAMHMDLTEADKQDGIKVTIFQYGKKKTWGNPHVELPEEAQKEIQGRVNAAGDSFTKRVAAARGLSVDAVRKLEAGTFTGQAAIDAGLADDFGDYEDVLDRFAAHLAARSRDPKQGLAGSASTETGGHMSQTNADAAIPVVDADQIRAEAKKEATEAAQVLSAEIAALCKIAGKPALAADFIEKGMTAAKVREALLEAAVTETKSDEEIDTTFATKPEGEKANSKAPAVNMSEIACEYWAKKGEK